MRLGSWNDERDDSERITTKTLKIRKYRKNKDDKRIYINAP